MAARGWDTAWHSVAGSDHRLRTIARRRYRTPNAPLIVSPQQSTRPLVSRPQPCSWPALIARNWVPPAARVGASASALAWSFPAKSYEIGRASCRERGKISVGDAALL